MEKVIVVLKKRLEELESYYSQEKNDNILIDISIEIEEINKLIKFLESLEQTIGLVIVPSVDEEPEMAFNQMKILKILTDLKSDSTSAPSEEPLCIECDGTGIVNYREIYYSFEHVEPVTCPACKDYKKQIAWKN